MFRRGSRNSGDRILFQGSLVDGQIDCWEAGPTGLILCHYPTNCVTTRPRTGERISPLQAEVFWNEQIEGFRGGADQSACGPTKANLGSILSQLLLGTIKCPSQKLADCLGLRRFRIGLRGDPALEVGFKIGVQAQPDVRANTGTRSPSASLFFVTGY